MKIRIIREKKIEAQRFKMPGRNSDFTNVHQPPSNPSKSFSSTLNVFICRQVWESIHRHAEIDMSIEMGGALLGLYGEDNGQPFILVTDVLHQPPQYSADPTMVRFTRQFYDDVEYYMDQLKANNKDILRLGLYHTHPNYGVFMSRTDEQTLKGIFKAPYQIAMVVDPVKREDGVFMMSGQKVTRQQGFKIYDTPKPEYRLHQGQTLNPLIARYNAHLQLDPHRQITPKIPVYTPPNSTPPKTIKTTQNIDKRSKISLRQAQKHTTTPPNSPTTNTDKTKMQVKRLDFIPKICPLFNLRFECRTVTLRKYVRPVKTLVDYYEFPMMLFFEQALVQQLEKQWHHLQNKKMGVLALLLGNSCYDKSQNLYFLELTSLQNEDQMPRSANLYKRLQLLLKDHGLILKNRLLGWVFLTENVPQPLYPLYEPHKHFFKQKHQMGMIVKMQQDHMQMEDTQIIAYDPDYQKAFEYFQHLFLYRRVY